MSFLTELMAKKGKLKTTTTVETYPDGSQKRIKCTQNIGVEEIEICTNTNKYGFVVDTKPDTIPACILPNFLYLGSQDAVSELNVEQYQLTDILSVGIEAPSIQQNPDRPVNMHFISCLDLPETKLENVVMAATAIIDAVRHRRPNGIILVHCNAGVSRSSTVCIAYLMKSGMMTFSEAYDCVKSKRECIRPNDGFLKQLKELDASNRS